MKVEGHALIGLSRHSWREAGFPKSLRLWDLPWLGLEPGHLCCEDRLQVGGLDGIAKFFFGQRVVQIDLADHRGALGADGEEKRFRVRQAQHRAAHHVAVGIELQRLELKERGLLESSSSQCFRLLQQKVVGPGRTQPRPPFVGRGAPDDDHRRGVIVVRFTGG